MRSLIASIFVLRTAALQVPSIFAPFYEAHLESPTSNETLIPNEHDLLRRDGNCPVNYDSCTTLNAKYGGACCTVGSICTTDKAQNIACCPTGATCTGALLQEATGTTGTVATTTDNGATITSASYIDNMYFPFPVIATSYPNSEACDSAYQACQSNYAACNQDPQGGGFEVTIVAPNGGGITVSPTVQNLGAASATSICSSLSAAACLNLQSSNCAQFGTGTTTGGTFIVGTNGAPRPTVMAAAGMMAGVGLGIAGQLL